MRGSPSAVVATSRVSAIQPGGVALRRREVKTAGGGVHEAAGVDVELAVAVGVAAVGGERQQGPAVRFARRPGGGSWRRGRPTPGLRRRPARPHPAGHPTRGIRPGSSPSWCGATAPSGCPGPSRSCSTTRRACPPWRSGRWSPAPPGSALEGGVVRVLQEVLGAGVLLPDPGQRFLAVDFLQPDVLVRWLRGNRGGVVPGGGGGRWTGRLISCCGGHAPHPNNILRPGQASQGASRRPGADTLDAVGKSTKHPDGTDRRRSPGYERAGAPARPCCRPGRRPCPSTSTSLTLTRRARGTSGSPGSPGCT